jgi:hypothetical protein
MLSGTSRNSSAEDLNNMYTGKRKSKAIPLTGRGGP